MGLLLGIDIGGTFTDFVAYDPDTAQLVAWKSLSVAGDPVSGILRGLEMFEHRARIDKIRLGTTVATNALLERTVAEVAYVTTKGFRDVPFVQRGNRRYHYNLQWVKPKPLVERRHCYEVEERIDRDGVVVQPLDETGTRALAQEIAANPAIQAVAVVLLFSYLNPEHERRIKAIFAEIAPHLPVSISYDVLPRWKEYERASTTIADAALKPIVEPQLSATRERLAQDGITASVSVIRSNGGEMTLEAAVGSPVQLALSGPTGGVVAAKFLAGLLKCESLVTLDMGGTSTDCATIQSGKESFTTDFEVEWGVPIQIPMIDIRTIGAGGGSIAWVDIGGMMRVGPQSSRSFPGPACYGQGGLEPTVTDANVVLGRISPDNFLGGSMRLDAAAARAAVGKISETLGMELDQTALAIIDIANNNMHGALRSVLTERGLDPRDFTLMAFGGAGPLHICDLMLAAGIRRGIVPNYPGQLSAYGFTLTDTRVDRQRTTQLTSINFDQERAAQVLAQLVDEAVSEVERQQSGKVEVRCALEMRYLGQNYELELPIDRGRFEASDTESLWDEFHNAHETRFGFDIPGDVIEIVNFLVTALVLAPHPALVTLPTAVGAPEPTGRRSVIFREGARMTPVYSRMSLQSGHKIMGPALIEESASVTVLGSAHDAEIDEYGNVIIRLKSRE